MLVRRLIDTGTKLPNMSRNTESTEGILNNGTCDGRYALNMKTFEGRNRVKTVTDGVTQPVDRQVIQLAFLCINLFPLLTSFSSVIPFLSCFDRFERIYFYCYYSNGFVLFRICNDSLITFVCSYIKALIYQTI